MQGKTSIEAVNNYVGTTNLLVSCVTASILSVQGGYHPSAHPPLLALNDGHPVRLGGTSRLGTQ